MRQRASCTHIPPCLFAQERSLPRAEGAHDCDRSNAGGREGGGGGRSLTPYLEGTNIP